MLSVFVIFVKYTIGFYVVNWSEKVFYPVYRFVYKGHQRCP